MDTMRIGLACLLVVMISMTVRADIFLKYKKTTSSYSVAGQTVPEKTTYASSWIGKTKAWYDDGEKSCSIMDLKANKLILLDNKSKSYSVVPLDNKTSMIDKAVEESASNAEEAKQMKEMMKGMMGAMAAGMEMTVTPTQEKKKIGSWECVRYNITMTGMGESTSQLWATKQIKIDPAFFNKVRHSMMANMQGFDKILREAQKINGIPVLTRSESKVMNAEVRSEEQLVEHAEKAPPVGIFEVPTGYREMKQAKDNNDSD